MSTEQTLAFAEAEVHAAEKDVRDLLARVVGYEDRISDLRQSLQRTSTLLTKAKERERKARERVQKIRKRLVEERKAERKAARELTYIQHIAGWQV